LFDLLGTAACVAALCEARFILHHAGPYPALGAQIH
jgi:hypothetical protein